MQNRWNLLWTVASLIAWPLANLLFRMNIEGLERIPDEGPVILAADHVSVLDPPVLGILASRRRRTIHFLATHQLFDMPAIAWILRGTGQIRLHRGTKDSGAIEAATGVLEAGGLLGIFPEGKVNHEPDKMLRGHTGVARLALGTGSAVLPVGIWGTNSRWPGKGLRLSLPLRPKLSIEIGDPVKPHGDPLDADDLRAFIDEVMDAIEVQRRRARWEAGG
jgi:1-acyl-sn-glycerol-3-phosphate acyltransferase